MGDPTGVVDVGADGVLLLSTVEGEVAGSEQPESTITVNSIIENNFFISSIF